MAENNYKKRVMQRLRDEFPGCAILKNDSGYLQGVPDWTVLYGSRWAVLEIKDHAKAKVQPNQPHYIEILNDMSFAAFMYPENESEVFRDLHRAFADPSRYSRLSEPE